MKITIITGDCGVDVTNISCADKDIENLPERKILNQYDLSEYIYKKAEEMYIKNKNLTIITYSDVVFDTIRVFVRDCNYNFKYSNYDKKCSCECIFVDKDGKNNIYNILDTGKLAHWRDGMFDVKQELLTMLLGW